MPIDSGIYNALGPANDDYSRLFADSSNQSYFCNLHGFRPEIYPIGSEWDMLRPEDTSSYEILNWYDDGDNILSLDDTIIFAITITFDTIQTKIDLVTPFISIMSYGNELFLEMIDYNPLISDWPVPVNTYWIEIKPNYTLAYQIINWIDYDNSNDLTLNDDLKLYKLNGPDSGQIILGSINNYMTGLLTSPTCQGICGDANNDGDVNISDAIWLVNFTFVSNSSPPLPLLACGDANINQGVNVSDAVWIINFVFANGSPPGDCHPGFWSGHGGDCCPYAP